MNFFGLFKKKVQVTKENTKPGDKIIAKEDVYTSLSEGRTLQTKYRKGTKWTVSCITNNHGTDVAYFDEVGCCALSHFVHE